MAPKLIEKARAVAEGARGLAEGARSVTGTPAKPPQTIGAPAHPHPYHGPQAARNASELGLDFSDVVVMFACDDYYAPYLSVALQSIKETASPDRHYDIVILARDLTLGSMRVLHDQMTTDNIAIGFLDAETALGDIQLPSHGHFSKETYYRLLAPELLNTVEKALYLDADLVALRDVAELFDTDVTGKLLAATQDADTSGQADGYEPTIKPYLQGTVGLADVHDYLQAGVVLMNLAEFRERMPSDVLIALAASRHWQWLDQDVLNHVTQGDYVRVPMNWNTLMDWQGLRRTHIIAQSSPELVRQYEAARRDPYIVHYAGPDDRPWTDPDADMAEYWWAYAAATPYLEELVERYAQWHAPQNLPKRAQIAALYKLGLPLYDFVVRPGTWFRKFTITYFYRGIGCELI